MEAPDKIYIHSDNDVMGEVLSQKVEGDIEYIRKDVFIEKACNLLESFNLDWYQIREGVFSRQLIEDFKKCMKENKVMSDETCGNSCLFPLIICISSIIGLSVIIF